MKSSTLSWTAGIAVALAAMAGSLAAEKPLTVKEQRARGIAAFPARSAARARSNAPVARLGNSRTAKAPRSKSVSIAKQSSLPSSSKAQSRSLLGPGEPPANDHCVNAEIISGEGTFAFDNFFATEDGLVHSDDIPLGCRDEGIAIGSTGGIDHDVWYCWTAPCTGAVTVSTCEQTTVDTRIAVYDGCGVCPPSDSELFVFGCNDDSCLLQSEVTFPAIAGQRYTIRVGTFPGIPGDPNNPPAPGGTGTFSISCTTSPDPIVDGQCQDPPRSLDDVTGGLNSSGTPLLTTDDFSPATSGNISGIRWWGGYADIFEDPDGNQFIFDCAEGSTDSFQVRYYEDAGGIPGAVLQGGGPFSTAGGDLTVTGPILTGWPIVAVREYGYSATHPPVPVTADECYWVEISNGIQNANEFCKWYWAISPEGNKRIFQDDDGLSPPTYEPLEFVFDDMAFCSNLALSDSGACVPTAPTNDNCVNAKPVFNGANAFDSSNATTDGPSEASCGFLGNDRIDSDVWFKYTAPCTGTLRVGTCESTFDTRIAVYDGTTCPPDTAPLACNDDACGTGPLAGLLSDLSVPVSVDQEVTIRVGGFDGQAGPGVLDLLCVPDACQGATGDCCSSNSSPGCNNELCCSLICTLDPECCGTSFGWDVNCAIKNQFVGFCVGEGTECTQDDDCPPGDTCLTADAASRCGFLCDECPDGQIVFMDPDSGQPFADQPPSVVDARQPHAIRDVTALQGYDEFIVAMPEFASESCWSICETTSSGDNGILNVTPIWRCSGSGEECDTTADCNACDNNGAACTTDADCGVCALSGAPCTTANDCPELESCTDVNGTCVISGETCDPDGTRRIKLLHPIEAGATTTLTYSATSGTTVTGTFTSLPGDVGADGQTAAADIGVLVDCLNGVRDCQPRICDIDRVAPCAAADIGRLVDLLNGGGDFQSWLLAMVATDVTCP